MNNSSVSDTVAFEGKMGLFFSFPSSLPFLLSPFVLLGSVTRVVDLFFIFYLVRCSVSTILLVLPPFFRGGGEEKQGSSSFTCWRGEGGKQTRIPRYARYSATTAAATTTTLPRRRVRYGDARLCGPIRLERDWSPDPF